MATKNWYLTATTGDGWRTIDEATQTAATSTDGWVVSTGATLHSEYAVGVERAATTFVGTTVPDGTLDTSLKDAFRTTNAYNGTFASGNWVFNFVVRATTLGGTQDGRVRFRLIKANADGSSATEITAAQQSASIVTNVSESADFNSTLTFNPGAITLTNQYLFVQIAWERTGAGGMTTSDINWRTGSSASAGTRITSSDFTPAAQTLTPSLFSNSNTFYTHTLTAIGPTQTLTPSLYENSNTFYSPTINLRLFATKYDNSNTFYAPQVTVGTVTLSPSLYSNTNAFYTPSLSVGPVNLVASLYSNTNTFYSATVSPGPIGITAPLLTNTTVFYSPTITTVGGVVSGYRILENGNDFRIDEASNNRVVEEFTASGNGAVLQGVATLSVTPRAVYKTSSSLNGVGSISALNRQYYSQSYLLTGEAAFTASPTLVLFTSTAYIKYNGVWTSAVPYVRHNGTWKLPVKVSYKVNGSWVRAY